MKLLLIALLAIATVSCVPLQKGKKVCEPGSFFKKDCNDCTCANDGMGMACTLKLCLPEMDSPLVRTRRRTVKEICQPGATKKEGCNPCFCNEDGLGWACTLTACPPRGTAEQ